MDENIISTKGVSAAQDNELPMDVRLQLADLARVPEEKREEFCNAIRLPLRLVWKLDRRAKGTRAGKALVRTAEAARALHEGFADLNADDRKWIDELLDASLEYKLFLPALPRLVRELEHLFSVAVGKAPLQDASRTSRDGRRKGVVKDLAFHEFVRYLLLVAEGWCGGKLTFDKNKKRGTLIDAINILRPYLPQWIVPSPLPFSTIQRIRSKEYYYAGFHGVTAFDE